MLKKLLSSLLALPMLFTASCASSNFNRGQNNGGNTDNQNLIVDSKGEHVKGNLQIIVYSLNEIRSNYQNAIKGLSQTVIEEQHFYEDFFVKIDGTGVSPSWTRTERVNNDKDYYLFSLADTLKNTKFSTVKELPATDGKVKLNYTIKDDVRFILNFTPYDSYYSARISLNNFYFNIFRKKENNSYINHSESKYIASTYNKTYGGTFNIKEVNLNPSATFSESEINNLYIGVSVESLAIDLSEPVD